MASMMIRLFEYADMEAQKIGAVCHPPAFSKTVGMAHLIHEGLKKKWILDEGPTQLAKEVNLKTSPEQTYRHLYISLENMGLATLSRDDNGKIRGIDLRKAIEYTEEMQKKFGKHRMKWLGQAIYAHLCDSFEALEGKKDIPRIGPTKIRATIEIAKISEDNGVVKIPDKKWIRPITHLSEMLKDSTGCSRLTTAQTVESLESHGMLKAEGKTKVKLVWSRENEKKAEKCIERYV